MNKKIFTNFMLLCCILMVSCSNEDERSSLSVIGTWNATTLIEDEVYTDLEKEEHNEVEISYGSYVWVFVENGDVKVIASVDDFKWYKIGEEPTNYQTFIFNKNQMKLLMRFSDASKSPAIYDVLELSDTEMILRDSAKWLNLGEGEIIITRTLTLKRIN